MTQNIRCDNAYHIVKTNTLITSISMLAVLGPLRFVVMTDLCPGSEC